MIQIEKFLDFSGMSPEEKKAYEVKYGGYNTVPPNFREITYDEFAKSDFFSYSFTTREFRQFKYELNPSKPITYVSCWLYYMLLGHGYGFISDFWGQEGKKLRIFKFGCKHQFVELTQQECKEQNILHFGRCWYVYKCQLCGIIKSEDNGD